MNSRQHVYYWAVLASFLSIAIHGQEVLAQGTCEYTSPTTAGSYQCTMTFKRFIGSTEVQKTCPSGIQSCVNCDAKAANLVAPLEAACSLVGPPAEDVADFANPGGTCKVVGTPEAGWSVKKVRVSGSCNQTQTGEIALAAGERGFGSFSVTGTGIDPSGFVSVRLPQLGVLAQVNTNGLNAAQILSMLVSSLVSQNVDAHIAGAEGVISENISKIEVRTADTALEIVGSVELAGPLAVPALSVSALLVIALLLLGSLAWAIRQR